MASIPDPTTSCASSLFSDTIQVVVGSAKPFTVHGACIAKLPFFERCLANLMVEGQSNVIRLPEDDPKVFEVLLGRLCLGKDYDLGKVIKNNATSSALDALHPIKRPRRRSGPFQLPDQSRHWLEKIYCVTEKYEFEEVQNGIIDIVCKKGRIRRRELKFTDLVEKLPATRGLIRYHISLVAYVVKQDREMHEEPNELTKYVFEWLGEGAWVIKEIMAEAWPVEKLERP